MSRALALTAAVALAAQTPLAQAEIVDTDALAVPSQVELDRAKVQSFLERANVKERMQAMGLSGLVAADRVASLSEAEVHALAERIDGLPAGGALSQQDWILILLVVLIIVIAL
ncbi:PA2779 family protein [Ramlibacter tataouinensis]|uniref:PA2779 family protein n=2 Tax=Ramlibacter tataouinensis TaxID=94132 RepID=A0A127JZ17_9BURK|nr:hypothetical protein UC35_02110 [Ramlibacter tataouinensis]